MTDLVKIAVDAMGGDGSPKKTIDGIVHHHKENKDVFYKIFGNKSEITPLIDDKILKDNYEIFHTDNSVKSTDSPLEAAKSCLLYTSPSPRDRTRSRMPSSA